MFCNRRHMVFVALLFSLPFLSACKGHVRISIYMNSFGYAYDKPTMDWIAPNRTDTELLIYGPEGKIMVDFLLPTPAQKPEDVFNDSLDELAPDFVYLVSEYQRNNTTYLFAKLDGVGSDEDVISPYLMVFPFDGGRIALVKGWPDKQRGNRSESLFKEFVFSLAPYKPAD
jgi:hypothetical protein